MHDRIRHLMQAERAACALGALACFALAAILAPSSVRSQTARSHAPIAVPAATLRPMKPIEPARDAFAPRAEVDDEPVLPARALPVPPALQPHALPLTARPLGTMPTVTAIALGTTPTALVEIEGLARAVSVGDALAGSRVTAISANGVELADGHRFGIAQDPHAP